MWLSGQVFLTMRLQRMWAKGMDISLELLTEYFITDNISSSLTNN